MDERVGQILARLSEGAESGEEQVHIDRINRAVDPERPVCAGEVYVRSMLVLSDRVNSFGGRFPAEEHGRLAELLVDSPVLVGHRKDSLPVGRTFHAECVERDGVPWVLSYFYWLKGTEGAEDLRRQIDQGVVKECSIGFVFGRAECSICGRDIRTCEHQPLASYRVGGCEKQCWFDYRDIRKVLETSLVYRGATPDTKVGARLAVPQMLSRGGVSRRECLPPQPLDLAQMDPLARCVVMPRYEGIPARLHIRGSHVLVRDTEGRQLAETGGIRLRGGNPAKTDGRVEEVSLAGVLVGYKGKSRCSEQQVRRCLDGLPGPVVRLKLMLWPGQASRLSDEIESKGRLSVDVMPHAEVQVHEIPVVVARLGSRDGAWVCWSGGDDVCQVASTSTPHALSDSEAVAWLRATEDGRYLLLSGEDSTRCWRLQDGATGSLGPGRGVLVEPIDVTVCQEGVVSEQMGALVKIESGNDGAWRLRCGKAPFEGLSMRPVVLNGRRRWLLSVDGATVARREVRHD